MDKLDHVGIYVRDLERTLAFYEEVFGFPEHQRFGSGESRIVVLDMGGGLLELIQRPGAPGRPPEGRWSHVAIQVDDFDGKVAKVESRGLEVRKVTMADGSRIAFFSDPDGHTFEIMEKGLNR